MKKILESIDSTGEFSRSPAYKDYMAIVREIKDTRQNMDLEDAAPQDLPDDFYSNVEMLLRWGPLTKLGQGSSRTAYKFDADPRYVLKFAHNANGLAQNQTEIKNAKLGSGDYDCVVRILAYDVDDVLIVEDFCRASDYKDWYRILGIGPNTLSKVIRLVLETNDRTGRFSLRDLYEELQDYDRAADLLRKKSHLDDEFTRSDWPKILNCIKNVLDAHDGKPVDFKWKSVADLLRFYCDNGMSAMIPEELLYIDQWGIKAGTTPDKDALVIIDPGVDADFAPFAGQNGRVK